MHDDQMTLPSSVSRLWLFLQRQDIKLAQLNLRRLHRQNLRSEAPVVAAGGPVLSLTTYGARARTVYLVLESIAAGSLLPSRLILWVDDVDLFKRPPLALKRLISRGLEIYFTQDYGPHKKYYPYLLSSDHLGKPLVTADDDVLYSHWWLEGLANAHREYPGFVSCYRAFLIRLVNDTFQPYETWRQCTSSQPSFAHLPLGVSGCIYPAPFLETLKLAGSHFLRVCPKADDIWLHVNALRAGVKVRQIRRWATNFPAVPGTQCGGQALTKANSNDEQITKTYTPGDIARLRHAVERVSSA